MVRIRLEHDIHEIGERRERGPAVFVSFAYFASFVFQVLTPPTYTSLYTQGGRGNPIPNANVPTDADPPLIMH